jgi:hypothetical protein
MVRHLIPTEQRSRAREHDAYRYVSKNKFRKPTEDYTREPRRPTRRHASDPPNTLLCNESMMVQGRKESTDARGRSRTRAISPTTTPMKMRSTSPPRSGKVQPSSRRSRSLAGKTRPESSSAVNTKKTLQASRKESTELRRKKSEKSIPVKSSRREIVVKPVKKIPFIPVAMLMTRHRLTSKVASLNRPARLSSSKTSKLQVRSKRQSKAKSLVPARTNKKAAQNVPDQNLLDQDLGYRSTILSSSTSTLSMNDNELNAAAKVALDRLLGDDGQKRTRKIRKTTAAPSFFNRSCSTGFALGQSGESTSVARTTKLPSKRNASLDVSPFLCGPKLNHQQSQGDTSTILQSTNSPQEDETASAASTQLSSVFPDEEIRTMTKSSKYSQNSCMTSFAMLLDQEMTESATTSKSRAGNRPTLQSFGVDDRNMRDKRQPIHCTTCTENKRSTTTSKARTKKSAGNVVESVRELTKTSTSVARKSTRRTTGSFNIGRSDSDPVKVFGWAADVVKVDEQAAIDSVDKQVCGPNRIVDSPLQDVTIHTSDIYEPTALETVTEEDITKNTAHAKETNQRTGATSPLDRLIFGASRAALEPVTFVIKEPTTITEEHVTKNTFQAKERRPRATSPLDRLIFGASSATLETVTEDEDRKQWKPKNNVDVLSECIDEFEVIEYKNGDGDYDDIYTAKAQMQGTRWWQRFSKKTKDALPAATKQPSMTKSKSDVSAKSKGDVSVKRSGECKTKDQKHGTATEYPANKIQGDQQQQQEKQEQETRQIPRSKSMLVKNQQSVQRRIFSKYAPRSFQNDLTATVQRTSRLRGVRESRIEEEDEREQDIDDGYNMLSSSSAVRDQASVSPLSAIAEEKSQLDGHVELLAALRLKLPLMDHMRSDLTSECGTTISTSHQDSTQPSV